MATKMNENGVSTCKAGEKYEKIPNDRKTEKPHVLPL